VGLDGLKIGALTLLAFAAAACGGDGRPKHLLYGGRAAEFPPVAGSVVASARVIRRSTLGDRFDNCFELNDATTVAADALVLERVGIRGESLTFATRDGTGAYACDGGVDPAGEREPPWCGLVFGEREAGRLLDPRLDVNCRDHHGDALAYVFVEPTAGARWIGVQQDGYVELYKALAGLPVRIATSTGIDLEDARATVQITQYDAKGRELIQGQLEAAVAG
jgi:hypothetical protein